MAEMTESLVDAKIGKAKAEFGGNIREAIATMNGLRSDIDAKFANMDAKFERHKVWFPGTAGGVIVAVVGLNFGVGKIFC